MIARSIAKLLSVVFHPLLMLSYMLVLLMVVNPYLIVNDRMILFLNMLFTTFLIPMVGVLMLRAVGLISSLEMPKKEERIGPLLITGVFYLWMYYNLHNGNDFPVAIKIGALGATMGLFMALIFNLFTKISLHALGMGGLLGFTLLTLSYFTYNSFFLNIWGFGTIQVSTLALLLAVLLICGIVCTARMFLRAHSLQDIYAGFIVGLSTQFIAMMILT